MSEYLKNVSQIKNYALVLTGIYRLILCDFTYTGPISDLTLSTESTNFSVIFAYRYVRNPAKL